MLTLFLKSGLPLLLKATSIQTRFCPFLKFHRTKGHSNSEFVVPLPFPLSTEALPGTSFCSSVNPAKGYTHAVLLRSDIQRNYNILPVTMITSNPSARDRRRLNTWTCVTVSTGGHYKEAPVCQDFLCLAPCVPGHPPGECF